MTKKEELLDFIETNINTTNTLQIHTIITSINEPCTMIISVRKERMTIIFTENFTDELIGHMPGDITTHNIVSWEAV